MRNLTLSADKQAFEILQKFGKGLKGGLPGFVANSAGRVALRLAGQTYPGTLEEGKTAISKDLSRIWRPVGQLINIAKKKDPRAAGIINGLYKSGKMAELNAYLRKLGVNIVVSEDVDPKQHKENRNKRTGRAYARPKQDVLIFDRNKISTYALVPERRIGLAAHGWVQASRAAGRKRRSSDVLAVGKSVNVNRIPPFKDKPGDIPHINGEAVSNGSLDNPIITISNKFPGLKRVMKQQAIGFALRGEGEILSRMVKAASKKEAAKLGLKT